MISVLYCSLIGSMSEIHFHKYANKNTLVVFDVDDVLTTPNVSTGIFTQNRDKYADIISEFKKHYPEYEKNYEIYSSIIFKCQQEIVLDPAMLNTIEDLKHKNIKTIDHNIFYLKKGENSLIYYKGIIYTDGCKKGKALELFFCHVKFWPKIIIFVDDSLKKIKNVEEICKKHKIKFYGYHYKRCLPTKWDEDLVRSKILYLIKNKIWFKNDQESQKYFQNVKKRRICTKRTFEIKS